MQRATTKLRDVLLHKTPSKVWILELNRPERLNALSEPMGKDILDVLDSIKRSSSEADTCRGLIVTGNPRAFSTGRDLKLSKSHSPEEAKRYLDLAIETVISLSECEVPTCAAVEGHAIGWGFEFALAADFRIASPSASFRLPETSLGLFPGAAMEWIFSARTFVADEALRYQVIRNITPNPMQEAVNLLEEFSQNAPLAIKAAKRAIQERTQIRFLVEQTRKHREPLSDTRDYGEALRAFAEKRKPVFSGT